MKKLASISGVLFFLPFIAFAQTQTGIQVVQGWYNLIDKIGTIIGLLIPILVSLAVVVFFWGLIKYITGGEKGRGEGKQIMIAGIVSLFVMVSLWGIITLLQSIFNIDKTATQSAPTLSGFSTPYNNTSGQ